MTTQHASKAPELIANCVNDPLAVHFGVDALEASNDFNSQEHASVHEGHWYPLTSPRAEAPPMRQDARCKNWYHCNCDQMKITRIESRSGE